MIRTAAEPRSLPRQAQPPRACASRALAAVACVFMGTGVLVAPAVAQEASPAAGEVVEATECRVEPLTDDYLLGFVATPASDATPAPDVAGSPAPFTEPEGEPAGEAEIEAVTATVRELVACLNAADYRRVYALYTEQYLARNFAGLPQERVLATPAAAAQVTENALVAIENVIVLPDGRLAAQIQMASGSEALPVSLYSVFAQVEDRWLIDEETVLGSAGDTQATPGSATPAN